MFLILAICTLFFSLSTAPVEAQGLTELIGVEPLILSANPVFPAPRQNVTVTVSSNEYNLGNSTITWSLNGKPIEPRGGNTSVVFNAGETGTRNSVTVTIRPREGGLLTKQFEIRTASVDLVWETNSYTPPFYRGKALPSAGSTVTINALPDIRTATGRKLTTNELIFTWQQNSRVLGDSSGRSQNTITLPGPEIYKPFSVLLEVTSLDKTLGGTAILNLNAVTPTILLYENHPTLGLRLERNLKEIESITGGEITVSAQPYFISTERAGDPDMRYTWSLNGNEVQNPSTDKSLILLRPASEGGTAQIEVVAQNLKQIFQQGRKSFQVNFTGNELEDPFSGSRP